MPSHRNVKPSTRRKPLKTMPLFIAAHEKHEACIRNYHHTPRKRSVLLSQPELDQFAPLGATFLRSNNTAARINFATIASEHMARLVETLDRAELFGFVTLASKRFAVAEGVAQALDIKLLIAWTQDLLDELNFVGMVEAALYTNIGAVLGGPDRVVSFHIHAITWGATEDQLDKIVNAVNAEEEALVPGISPGHYRMLRRNEVAGQVIYMSKTPLNDHRIYALRSEVVDDETGEVTTPTNGAFKQRKQPLRRADAVCVFRIMCDRYVDKLAFAGGDGVDVLAFIRHEARRAWRIYKIKNSREVTTIDRDGNPTTRTIVL
jgi:hypothetical protein